MLTNNKIKWIIARIAPLFSLINKVIPKQPHKIMLYANFGFEGNLEPVFEYLINQGINKKYLIVCSINDKGNIKFQKTQNVIFTNNYIGWFHFFTSKYFFYDHERIPIEPGAGQVVVNLWHGTPLKNICNLEKRRGKIKFDYFTYLLATSEGFKEIMKNAFHCPEKKIIICGQPRSDLLFQPNSNKFKQGYSKLITWLPTFRRSAFLHRQDLKPKGALPIFNSYNQMLDLDRFLNKHNILLLIKFHPAENIEKNNKPNFSNIRIFYDNEFKKEKLELYKILAISDALITDYSSVYFDYLLLNRPIAFTIDDIEKYKDSRGFVFDQSLDYMPGWKISNQAEFSNFLESLVNNIDNFQADRKRINDFANYYKDGGNCKRLLELINLR
jgi:CDP-glycerol glycerophosphotransferase (TagB/SpsB family)